MRPIIFGAMVLGAALPLGLAAYQPQADPLRPVVARDRGMLTGKVLLRGDPAAAVARIDKAYRDAIARHPDRGACQAGARPEELTQQAYRIGDNKQIGNVFIWIEPPNGSYFPIDAAQLKEARRNKVEIEISQCNFVPHCAVHFAAYADPENPSRLLPTGQPCVLRTDGPIAFAVQICGSARNPIQSWILPAVGERTLELNPDRFPLRLTGLVHPWMHGWVRVFGHPYATLSRSDTVPAGLRVRKDDRNFGSYKIENIPAGVRVRLYAWHEKVGWLTAGGRDGEVLEVRAGENVRDFEMEAADEP
jgi:hypothetical protein